MCMFFLTLQKFQSGVITVGEFFTLLQVHIPIQKPRQSHLPANVSVCPPDTHEALNCTCGLSSSFFNS